MLKSDLIISPSILAADFNRLGEEIKAVEKAGANCIHVDVMDGVFVPSLSFGLPVIRSIRSSTTLCFDVHLMISNADLYIQDYAEVGADSITVHVEAVRHLDRTLSQIKTLGKRCGVAINPATAIDFLPWVIDQLDLILVMTVNPGFGGQCYLHSQQSKIQQIRTLINERGYRDKISLQVDGGINNQTARLAKQAGANNLVAGSYIFKGDYEKNIQSLR